MTMNWLERMDDKMEQDSRPIAMPVFAGQKLAVVGAAAGWDAIPPPTWWPSAAAP
jgi:hypothetical protein